MEVNIFTFKWGTKYGPEYTNRLFGSLCRHIDVPFTFTCITDDTTGLDERIQTIDYDTFDPFDYPKDRVFTREKVVLFKRFQTGNNFWIDQDILIHNNITDLVTGQYDVPKFIWNYWNWNGRSEFENLRWFGKGVQCYVNSSFVGWSGNAGEFIYDYLDTNQVEAFHTYKSLDKFLFYQFWRRDKLDFWEDGLWYNYNFSDPPFTKVEDAKGCIFNTSHIKANNLDQIAYEIHETEGWAKELWESYDRTN